MEKKNPTIFLNVLYDKEIKTCLACISKTNWNCGKQKIISMISSKKKESWHYLAVEKLSAILKTTISIKVVILTSGIAFSHLEKIISLSVMKKYAKTKIFVELYYHPKK